MQGAPATDGIPSNAAVNGNVSPLHQSTVTSLSTKLNFILDEVRRHSRMEKTLIFSNSPLTLNYIAEGLELLDVKYSPARSMVMVKAKDRRTDPSEFEHDENLRVYLMELKNGARGLNMVSASRVIFCEPVEHADVETQAVKRVHRIGQILPVTVTTLAVRSTFEEVVVENKKRRRHSSSMSSDTGIDVVANMREYLERPRFIEACEDEQSQPRFSVATQNELPADDAVKKGRTVRFAE